MFREKALTTLASPEQLDQLLQVVNRKSWIPIGALAGGLLLTITWSIAGQLPVTVKGSGILVYPRQIVSFQSPAAGQIVSLNIKVDDFVNKGQILGTINQPALRQRLKHEHIRLAELQDRTSQVLSLRDQRSDLEKHAIQGKRQMLERRITSTLNMANAQKAKNEIYIAKQSDNLERLRAATQRLGQALQKQYESFKVLKSEGLSSDDVVLNARRNYIDNKVAQADSELKVHEIELRRIEIEKSYLEQMDKVAQLESQLQELEVQEAQINQQELETVADSQMKIQEIRRTIDRYEKELQSKGLIMSEYEGRVLEVTVAVGQIISTGQRISAIETENPQGTLVAIGYFKVSDGKKINPDMDIRITPTTVQRERYGSMRGKVSTVSRFPVTTDAVTNVVGNAEIAHGLVAGGGKIEIFSNLSPSASSLTGYQWTSGEGPDIKITAGTTVELHTTVEYRRPITYVIPILRNWSGI